MKKMKQSLIVILILTVGIMSLNGCKADDPDEAIFILNNAPDGFIMIAIYSVNKIPETYLEFLETCSPNGVGSANGYSSPFTISFLTDAPSGSNLVSVRGYVNEVPLTKMGVFEFSGKNSKITADWNSMIAPEWLSGTD